MAHDTSCYQEAFHLYMYHMGRENAAVYLPDTPENRATRKGNLNCMRQAWKEQNSKLPDDLLGDMAGIRFLSCEADGMLLVYADKEKPKRFSVIVTSTGDLSDEFI